ncbi:MAG: prolipoprotein diacylglyceryl transferase [Acidobacteriaceae bacterium]
MYPYINLGFAHIGTFGLMLWLAAVCSALVLYKNFQRNGADADAINIVTMVVLSGIVGAKLWHELQNIPDLIGAWREILAPGLHHPTEVLFNFLHWFQAGFAWYGGLLAAVAMLMYQGVLSKPNGLTGRRAALRMMDFAAPAAAVGYGVGRLGCLLSGDGDYGINTTLPWGVHMANGLTRYTRALVLPNPPTAAVQPTPIYELLFSLALAWWLWKRGSADRALPLGFLTGEYLLLSGIGRFLVEFVRINPKLYLHHTLSNAQVAAFGSMLCGMAMMIFTRRNGAVDSESLPKASKRIQTAT